MSSTLKLTGQAKTRRLDSLRWRLPVFVGVLIVVMLGTFLWEMSRAVEGALVDAGRDRAENAARKVTGFLDAPIKARQAEVAKLQADTVLHAALRTRSPQALDSVRRMLTPRSPSRQASRNEVWDNRGSLVLAVVTPRPANSTVGVPEFPPGVAPKGKESGELQALGNANYHSIVVEIHDDSAHGGALLGYLRLFGQGYSEPRGAIKGLVGDSATLKLGSFGSNVWTDFDDIVAPPPELQGKNGSGEFRDANGRRWIGALVPIKGTPWFVWTGYPRSTIVAPAMPFMRHMIELALVFIAAAAVLLLLWSVRITRPLHEMAHAAEQMAAGDYTHRVSGRRRDEIGRLGGAFNTMAERIESAHTALRESHQQTHFALAAARIAVWQCDLSSGRMQCSVSMNLLHNLSAGKLPETSNEFIALLHPDDRAAVRKVLEGRVNGSGDFDMQYRTNGPAGTLRWMEGKGRIIRDDSGNGLSVLGVSIDVTDRTQLEAQVRQSQKMEAIGQLAGGIAHDFNNLLTAIIGHSELILLELDDKDKLTTDTEGILNAAETATKMTRQLLAFSRGQMLHPEVIDVNAVIVNTEQILGRLIGEHIQVVADLGSDVDLVKADASQLQQVILNLALNARDAMPSGGKVSITSSNVYLDGDYASEHADVVEGWHVMISVSDTGSGIDAETRAHLFEPFFTTKPAGQGTGLGLATVYGIVKQSGGHIYVYSEVGRGTTFKIYLPVTRDEMNEPRKQPPLPPPAAIGREDILLVEDNKAVSNVGRKILERLGYGVMCAATAEEAFDILKRVEVKPRLLITDVFLPGMTGPDLYREVAAVYPEMRVIFTSGYSPDAIAPHATLDPGFLFVPKPYNPTTLASKVHEALGS